MEDSPESKNRAKIIIISKLGTRVQILMKASFALQWGTAPTAPKMHITARVKGGAEHGKAAHDRFSALLGEDFKVGVVFQAQTSQAEKIQAKFDEEVIMDGAPGFVCLKQHTDSTGYYVAFNAKIDEAGLPPQILGVNIGTPFTLSVDVNASKSFADVLDFVKAEPELERRVVGSRVFASLMSDLRAQVTLELQSATLVEVWDQVKDLIPVPVPLDPSMVGRIFESAELEINLDNNDKLPKQFLNNFWNVEVSRAFAGFLRTYSREFKGFKGGLDTFGEISDVIEPKSLFIHVFSQKIGSVEVEINLPGLYTLASGVKDIMA